MKKKGKRKSKTNDHFSLSKKMGRERGKEGNLPQEIGVKKNKIDKNDYVHILAFKFIMNEQKVVKQN